MKKYISIALLLPFMAQSFDVEDSLSFDSTSSQAIPMELTQSIQGFPMETFSSPQLSSHVSSSSSSFAASSSSAQGQMSQGLSNIPTLSVLPSNSKESVSANSNVHSQEIVESQASVAPELMTMQVESISHEPIPTNEHQIHYEQPLEIMQSFMSTTAQSDPIPIVEIETACNPNSVPNHNNVCIKPKYIEGCKQYSTELECYSCDLGYRLDSQTRSCNYNSAYHGDITHITGCISQPTPDSCDVCAVGFYRLNGKCLPGIKNCVSYNKEGNCLDCEEEYSLILSECRHNYLLGCKEETKSHTCSECYSPFELVDHHCDITQCRTLNDFGCVACECGFFLTADRTCKKIAPGCLRYERGVCKDCLSHYKLKGGVCEIEGCEKYSGNYCQVCQDDYENVEGECHFKHCYDWLNGNCVICNEGYGLKDGRCHKTEALVCE